MSDTDDFREPHLRKDDFLGAFGLMRREGRVLLVANRRSIDGRMVRTWDLPGGQVEPGEMLDEALRRELDEELGIRVRGVTPFLFYQEGEKRGGGRRRYAWRSFFFEVRDWEGEPRASAEIEALRWFDPAELEAVLRAPYHDSFLQWLQDGGRAFRSSWDD